MGKDCTSCTKNHNDGYKPLYKRGKKKSLVSGPTDTVDTLKDYELPDMTMAKKDILKKKQKLE